MRPLAPGVSLHVPPRPIITAVELVVNVGFAGDACSVAFVSADNDVISELAPLFAADRFVRAVVTLATSLRLLVDSISPPPGIEAHTGFADAPCVLRKLPDVPGARADQPATSR